MSRSVLVDAVEDMISVLDVIDAIHGDAPMHAEVILEQLGPIRTAEAALRLLDVITHVVLSEHPDGVSGITADDFTAYIRESLGGPHV